MNILNNNVVNLLIVKHLTDYQVVIIALPLENMQQIVELQNLKSYNVLITNQ